MIQWSSLHASNAGGAGSVPGGELRPLMPCSLGQTNNYNGEQQETLEVMDMLVIQIMVMVLQCLQHLQTHQTVCIKHVWLSVCQNQGTYK